MDTFVWGGILRFAQAMVAAGPTLLVGLVVAGVMRKLVGPQLTFQAFGGTSWRSLPQAWLWGMLLPVCSLGVIPVAYELRRSGLSGGAILAFALTAPLFNPLSLLYGLTLSEPIVILTFAVGSLLVVTVVGTAWDRLFPNTALPPSTQSADPPGVKRLVAVAVSSARSLGGPMLVYCLIGMAGPIVLSTAFGHGSLGASMAHGDPTAPLLMLGISVPAYATPLAVMQQVGSMFVHGNSVGAAYVLLSIGAGVNLGLLAWASRTYGLGRAMAFLAVFIAVVLAIAYSVENPLYTAGNVDHPHTHAFDVYSNPFPSVSQSRWLKLPGQALATLKREAALFEWVGLGCVAVLLVVGVALRVSDPEGKLDTFLSERHNDPSSSSALNKEVPVPVLCAVAIAGLVAASVLGCFVYYPPPEETLQDIQMVRAEALTYAIQKDVENAVRYIERFDELTRKLQIGYYLRHGSLDEFQRLRAKSLRGWLERLKDVVQAGEFERVSELNARIFAATRRCSEVFTVDK